MANIISAVFDDRDDAQQAVDHLRNRGIPESAITIVSRNGENSGGGADNRDAGDGAADAGSGALTGAGVGAGIGALFGLAALAIPGIGPFITAGALASALGTTGGALAAGAIVGAASGGLAGALSHWGLNEAEAHHYAGEVERGGTYVGVDLDNANADRGVVLEELRRHNGRVDQPNTTTGLGAGSIPQGSTGTAGTAFAGTTGSTGYGTTGTTGTTDYATHSGNVEGEVRVPLVEEHANVRKVEREVGEVAVTKDVEVERRHIQEPVSHTEVDVEVRDVTPGTYTNADTTLQPGQTIRVPVTEEELLVDKTAQVTGEAVIRTRRETEMAEQDVELRRERVDVHDTTVDTDEVDDTVGGRRTI